MSLSVVVITNKEKLDHLFISSLKFGDEIIVHQGEGETTDFALKRNEALKKAKSQWVLFVDDDEIVSRELAKEILESIKNTSVSGFLLRRVDLFFNEAIRFGEVGNSSFLRLAKRGSGKFERGVHEVWKVKGQIGALKNPLFHNKNFFLTQFLNRIMFYGPLDAKSLNGEGKRFSLFRLIFNPSGKFLLNYIFKLGFLDGYVGLFLAYFMSIQSLSVRIFQWEKENT